MKIPNVTFRMRHNDHVNLGNACTIGGVWKDVTTSDLFDNKKIVIFALPGAFTPTCSSKQLPGYESKHDQLMKFVDDVYCVSVNDAFVMNAWFKDLNIKPNTHRLPKFGRLLDKVNSLDDIHEKIDVNGEIIFFKNELLPDNILTRGTFRYNWD